MNAPEYVQKKQLIALLFSLLLISFREISQYFTLFSIVIASSFVFPLLKKKIQYSQTLQRLLLLSSLFLPLLVTSDITFSKNPININILLFGVFIVLVLLFSKRNDFKSILKFGVSEPINLTKFIVELAIFFMSIIGEELFFRVYTINFFKANSGLLAIVISSIFFVIIHYLNRWASKLFNLKSYVYQFLLSVVLGAVYYFSTNFLYVIFLHTLYNFSFLLILIRKLKHKNSEVITFDDYD
ncbi:CPBP family intramembrane glutamic endopeptidase [Enterococcus faecalis]|uniref:CPBP family intramembrane glutamic endopeptidase n=1 Tax=Enterococcus faecalis TaxID=1351 RepID=UPI0019E96625|nr:CPBP family intramembrane metalloprotease [Enterococcus faecalis]EGO8997125.1 CPBP family intramembrane metalloprotease [Enterococcus faecalis]EGQ7429183.1 CPBP family intramembrane metalloprotease [Enterococcus faecalis]